MLDVWAGKAKPPERTLFWEWRWEGHWQLAAMRGPYVYVITGKENRPELFDVVNDPAERRNLLAEQPALGKQLQKELDQWLKTEVIRNSSKSLVN